MKIGYIRVSSKDQNLERQLAAMKKEGITKIFADKKSGKNTNRTAFNEMLDFVRADDTLVIASLDRLSRDYDDIKKTIQLLQEKEVKLIVLDSPFLNFNSGNAAIDKLMFDMLLSLLSFVAQNEREKILERQMQGIAIAKREGKFKGKQPMYSPSGSKAAQYNHAVLMIKNGESVASIAKSVGIPRKTVYEIKKRYESEGDLQ